MMSDRKSGFSVVEVLAAVALISIAIVPLFEFQRTLTDAAVRIEANGRALEVERSALAFITTVNPGATPQGCEPIGEWNLCWSSQLIDFEYNPDGFLGSNLYSIGLFEISMNISRNSLQRQMVVRQLGWVLVRDPFADIGVTR